ncbi:MAG: C25 family cysteine peptidase [Candidatus Thermoplasmatota archaeon]
MKKILIIVLSAFLVTTAFASINQEKKISIEMKFDEPIIFEEEKTSILMKGKEYIMQAGEPILPYENRVLILPVNAKIEKVDFTISGEKEIKINKPIAIFSPPWNKNVFNEKIYPENWISYNIGVGLNNEKRVIFVSINAYPVRYLAEENKIIYVDNINIEISYSIGKNIFTNDIYDFLIIAHKNFVEELQPLVEHKESYGIRTKMVTMDEIYSGVYFESKGRDDAEKVKYFIKNAIEEWGIKYVMLVGGLSSPIKSETWLVPIRDSNLDDGSEKNYTTDLYFADIYKYENGSIVFDDWDSNGNGIFAEWKGMKVDKRDFYPDVYVGRLACRSEKEVTDVVNKIINYEKSLKEEWFKRVVLVGGDTFNDISGNNYYEGEIANQKVAEILNDFEAVKIWWSEGNVNQKNVLNALRNGCGFVHLSGHGSPEAWFVKDFVQNPHGKYIWALDVYHIPMIKNGEKLPIVVIGGCHNSMINTSLYKSTVDVIKTIIIKYILGKPYQTWYWLPSPECMGWWFVKQQGGGAIATFGCTGLGYGTIGDEDKDGVPDCIQYLLTWLELRFFEVYKNGDDILGKAWGTAIKDYINRFMTGRIDQIDAKTVEEWILLGDPTLKIGGYV